MSYYALTRLIGVLLHYVQITMKLPTTTTNGILTTILSGTRGVTRQVTGRRPSLVQGFYQATRLTKGLDRRVTRVQYFTHFQRTMTLLPRGTLRLFVYRRNDRLTFTMSVRGVPIIRRTTLRRPRARTLKIRLDIPIFRPTHGINTITNLVTRRTYQFRTYRRQNALFSRSHFGVALRIYTLPPYFSKLLFPKYTIIVD